MKSFNFKYHINENILLSFFFRYSYSNYVFVYFKKKNSKLKPFLKV